jgi:hypothetical protein
MVSFCNLFGANAFCTDMDHLTGIHIALKFSIQSINSHTFRADYITLIYFAKTERANTMGITKRIQIPIIHHDH